MSDLMRRLDAQERIIADQRKEIDRHKEFEATSKHLFQQYKTAMEQLAARVLATEKKTDITPEMEKVRAEMQAVRIHSDATAEGVREELKAVRTEFTANQADLRRVEQQGLELKNDVGVQARFTQNVKQYCDQTFTSVKEALKELEPQIRGAVSVLAEDVKREAATRHAELKEFVSVRHDIVFERVAKVEKAVAALPDHEALDGSARTLHQFEAVIRKSGLELHRVAGAVAAEQDERQRVEEHLRRVNNAVLALAQARRADARKAAKASALVASAAGARAAQTAAEAAASAGVLVPGVGPGAADAALTLQLADERRAREELEAQVRDIVQGDDLTMTKAARGRRAEKVARRARGLAGDGGDSEDEDGEADEEAEDSDAGESEPEPDAASPRRRGHQQQQQAGAGKSKRGTKLRKTRGSGAAAGAGPDGANDGGLGDHDHDDDDDNGASGGEDAAAAAAQSEAATRTAYGLAYIPPAAQPARARGARKTRRGRGARALGLGADGSGSTGGAGGAGGDEDDFGPDTDDAGLDGLDVASIVVPPRLGARGGGGGRGYGGGRDSSDISTMHDVGQEVMSFRLQQIDEQQQERMRDWAQDLKDVFSGQLLAAEQKVSAVVRALKVIDERVDDLDAFRVKTAGFVLERAAADNAAADRAQQQPMQQMQHQQQQQLVLPAPAGVSVPRQPSQSASVSGAGDPPAMLAPLVLPAALTQLAITSGPVQPAAQPSSAGSSGSSGSAGSGPGSGSGAGLNSNVYVPSALDRAGPGTDVTGRPLTGRRGQPRAGPGAHEERTIAPSAAAAASAAGAGADAEGDDSLLIARLVAASVGADGDVLTPAAAAGGLAGRTTRAGSSSGASGSAALPPGGITPFFAFIQQQLMQRFENAKSTGREDAAAAQEAAMLKTYVDLGFHTLKRKLKQFEQAMHSAGGVGGAGGTGGGAGGVRSLAPRHSLETRQRLEDAGRVIDICKTYSEQLHQAMSAHLATQLAEKAGVRDVRTQLAALRRELRAYVAEIRAEVIEAVLGPSGARLLAVAAPRTGSPGPSPGDTRGGGDARNGGGSVPAPAAPSNRVPYHGGPGEATSATGLYAHQPQPGSVRSLAGGGASASSLLRLSTGGAGAGAAGADGGAGAEPHMLQAAGIVVHKGPAFALPGSDGHLYKGRESGAVVFAPPSQSASGHFYSSVAPETAARAGVSAGPLEGQGLRGVASSGRLLMSHSVSSLHSDAGAHVPAAPAGGPNSSRQSAGAGKRPSVKKGVGEDAHRRQALAMSLSQAGLLSGVNK
jgi:hypothetical protein